jgi:uncharacterized protein (TIGR03000 family)
VGWFSSNQVQEVKQVYSVVLMMALTTGGDSAALGHRHGGSCCGEAASCGGRHHARRGRHECCGEVAACSSCGVSAGCSTCGQSYAPGYSSCANGACALADTGCATLVVSLPADAKLTINDEATTSTSDQRLFVSPTLPPGQEFYYTLKAEVMVNGKPVVVSEVVTVRSGEETKVTLAAPTGVASR